MAMLGRVLTAIGPSLCSAGPVVLTCPNNVLNKHADCLLSYHHHDCPHLQAEIVLSTSPVCILTQAGGVWLSCPGAGLSCRKAIESKRNILESLQKRCSAAQSKLEGEYSHLGSLEAKTKELEHLRKVLPHAVTCSSSLC